MKDSERMTELLLALRLDAEALGRSIGKRDGDVIRNVLKNKNDLSVKVAKAISEKHNVSYRWLLTGEGELFNAPQIHEKPVSESFICELCKQKDLIIEEYRVIIAEKNKTIRDLGVMLDQARLRNSG